MNWIHQLVFIAVVLGLIALWASALVSIARTGRGGSAALWIVAVVIFPFAGAIAWFWFGLAASRRRGALEE